MRFVNVLSLILCFAVCYAPVSRAESDSAEKKDEENAATSEENEAALLKDIPLGETFEGVRIPQLSPDGQLITLFDAKSARRVDDQNIEMEDLTIEFHNEDGSTFHISMAKSVFNLDTRVLTSDTPVNIRRDDFVIDGDAAEFHTKTKFGRMTGNVKMVIFNTDQN